MLTGTTSSCLPVPDYEEQFKDLSIRIHYSFRKEEPDGSECDICEQQCFLSMWRVWALIFGVIEPTKEIMCGSCHREMIEDEE
jgi:hypothetical protein